MSFDSPAPKSLLALQNVTRTFGGLCAVKDLSLVVREKQLFGLIGPNGAGKTTVFNLITGIYAPTQGEITFQQMPIQGRKPHQIAAVGIARTFQNIRLFSDLSVLNNVLVAKHMDKHQTFLGALFRSQSFQAEEKSFRDEARHLLSLFGLEAFEQELAGNLPYGSQRRLEIARALATRPQLLLLDEPAAGMNPHEAGELMRLIQRLRDEFHCSVLLVEHNMKVVMGVCETIHVMDHGETIAEGNAEYVRNHPKVIEAYLGGA